MARLSCRCGYSMWNGLTPNEIEFTVFSDVQACNIIDNPPALFRDSEEFVFDFTDLMDMADYEVWRCPSCGRLHVFDRRENPDKVKYVYRLEED